jgi:xanthine dehydrogenase YagR molybdenum-binding subunit
VPYIYALESAMDELAQKLGMDPIEFRRINDTMNSPIGNRPYSSRSLMTCYDQAAEAFGWKARNPQPGSTSDGDWLVGYGCATAVYPTRVGPAAARVRLKPNGEARVRIAAHEIGNGASTRSSARWRLSASASIFHLSPWKSAIRNCRRLRWRAAPTPPRVRAARC